MEDTTGADYRRFGGGGNNLIIDGDPDPYRRLRRVHIDYQQGRITEEEAERALNALEKILEKRDEEKSQPRDTPN